MRVLVMAVTKKDVFTAIESLEQQGITATNAAILEITGGSNATVQKYRKEYYDSRQAQAVKDAIVLKDTEITALTDAFASLLKQRVTGVQEQYTTDIAQLTTSLQEASSRIDELCQTVELQNESNRQANAEKVTAINEKTALQAHYDKERKELQAEIQRLNEIAYTQKGRADLLEERLKQYETKPKQPKTTAVKE
jgi:nitrogen regulatory protein PII